MTPEALPADIIIKIKRRDERLTDENHPELKATSSEWEQGWRNWGWRVECPFCGVLCIIRGSNYSEARSPQQSLVRAEVSCLHLVEPKPEDFSSTGSGIGDGHMTFAFRGNLMRPPLSGARCSYAVEVE